jgi:hypothetical protein
MSQAIENEMPYVTVVGYTVERTIEHTCYCSRLYSRENKRAHMLL